MNKYQLIKLTSCSRINIQSINLFVQRTLNINHLSTLRKIIFEATEK